MAYIVAIHNIADPERFWSSAAEATSNLPPGVSLHTTYPQGDGSRAVCLWEAESIDVVRDLVDGATGEASYSSPPNSTIPRRNVRRADLGREARALLTVVRDLPDDAGTALRVRHNPGLQQLSRSV